MCQRISFTSLAFNSDFDVSKIKLLTMMATSVFWKFSFSRVWVFCFSITQFWRVQSKSASCWRCLWEEDHSIAERSWRKFWSLLVRAVKRTPSLGFKDKLRKPVQRDSAFVLSYYKVFKSPFLNNFATRQRHFARHVLVFDTQFD